MSGLYTSGYTPRGTRKGLDRTSMTCSGIGQAGDVMRAKGVQESDGDPTEAVGWFDDDGRLIQLVADYANGKRVEFRRRSRDAILSIWFPKVSS